MNHRLEQKNASGALKGDCPLASHQLGVVVSLASSVGSHFSPLRSSCCGQGLTVVEHPPPVFLPRRSRGLLKIEGHHGMGTWEAQPQNTRAVSQHSLPSTRCRRDVGGWPDRMPLSASANQCEVCSGCVWWREVEGHLLVDITAWAYMVNINGHFLFSDPKDKPRIA